MNRLRLLWESLRSSLWFVPSIIVAAGVGLAITMIEIDMSIERSLLSRTWPRLFGAGAEGSRGLLGAIAGSMITVAGVTFSITVVALSLTSSQYTSRVLRNFMRDRANQTVLGVFVGVFAYCLVVLRTIRSRGEDDQAFVPALAVLLAMLLAFVAIGHLIYFIHHVASAIQATSILRAVAYETIAAIDRLFPESVGEAADEQPPAIELKDGMRWHGVPSERLGYIQAIEPAALFKEAKKREMVIRMERGIGEFIVEGSPLVSVTTGAVDDDLIEQMNDAYVIGQNRTVQQDAGYGIRQIVDVALKALSPGVNDTTTAITAVDYLGAILARLAERRIASDIRSPKDDDEARLIARGPSFSSLLAEALDEIRQNSSTNTAVQIRLLEMLAVVSDRTSRASRRAVVREQADLIIQACDRTIPDEADRRRVHAARALVL